MRNNRNGVSAFCGDLVTVSIDIVDADGKPVRKSRFFEPRRSLDREAGSSQDSNFYFRYTNLEVGERYGVTVRLHDGTKRYSCPIGVDGRSVMDGVRTPNLDRVNQYWYWGTGYVFNVDTENGATIKGWREDTDNARRFIVTDTDRSYAAEQWNDTSATGTIVIAVFREHKNEPAVTRGLGSRGLTEKGLGTCHAERVHSEVTEVEFVACNFAWEVFVLRYATITELQTLGVYVPEGQATGKDRIWPGDTATPRPRFWPFPK